MKELPDGMIPYRDNNVYYDTDNKLFYIISWHDTGNGEIPTRHYIHTHKQDDIDLYYASKR